MHDLLSKLDRIFEAQVGPGGEPGMPCTPFVLIGLYLEGPEVERLRPYFHRDADYPDVGEAGRYKSVPVFSLAQIDRDRKHYGSFEGILVAFVPASFVN